MTTHTNASKRILKIFETERMPNGRRWPTALDARLAERILEELLPIVEEEAVEMAVNGRLVVDK